MLESKSPHTTILGLSPQGARRSSLGVTEAESKKHLDIKILAIILLTHSFIHSLNKCLLNLFYIPCTALGPGDIIVIKTDMVPALRKSSV